MSTESFTNGYLLTEQPNGMFQTTEKLTGVTTVTDPAGSTLQFGDTVDVATKYNPDLQLRYDGTVVENGQVVGFSAVDPTDGQVYMFTDQSIPAGTDLVIDTGDSYTITCFMAGTDISTPDGLRAIETLSAGDLVLTTAGDAMPVRWLGRQTVARTFADPIRVLPIRIEAGALGDKLPVRDLLVSPEHALFLGNVLVQAGALVNGTTIRREHDVPTTFVYYHVELADHSLVLAEGVAVETFIDNVDRRAFDNWNEHVVGEPLSEMNLPRAKAHRQVPAAVRQQIAAVAAARETHSLAA